jgi:hypothetical protein
VIDALKKAALLLAQQNARPTTCPRCRHRFKPFAAAPPQEFSELTNLRCPKCGHTFQFQDATQADADAKANPPGPFSKPPESRIEMATEDGAWVYKIPRGRTPVAVVLVAAFWNLISWPVAFGMFAGKLESSAHTTLKDYLIMPLFPGLGLVLIYWALRLGWSTHRLTLGPQTVRLRRKVILSKQYEVPVSEITQVHKKEFYSENYKPVYGIEIVAGPRKIRFGSILTEDEKNWLCWQIREFARQRGAPVAELPPAPEKKDDDES